MFKKSSQSCSIELVVNIYVDCKYEKYVTRIEVHIV